MTCIRRDFNQHEDEDDGESPADAPLVGRPPRGAMVMGVAMAGVTMGVVVMTVWRVGVSGIRHGCRNQEICMDWAQ